MSPCDASKEFPVAAPAAGRAVRSARIGCALRLFIGAGIAVVALTLLLRLALNNAQTGGGTLRIEPGEPPNGQVVDGLACGPLREGSNQAQVGLSFYADGREQQWPAGIGLVLPKGPDTVAQASNGLNQCAYPVHMEGSGGIAHLVGSPATTYTLGQFFDVWGQPLTRTRVAGYQADASHPLTFVVFDAKGTPAPYTGDPRAIPLTPGTTVVILYNSPNVQPQPRTQWR